MLTLARVFGIRLLFLGKQSPDSRLVFLIKSMKMIRPFLCVAGGILLSALSAKATPYASGVTNIGGTIQFILNEIPDSAWYVFENGASNAIASPVVGTNTFPLGTNKSYAIYCVKAGNGTATQISSDSATYNNWNTPRGVGVNVNPTNGYLFGRVYVNNSLGGAVLGKGIFALNADQSILLGGKAGLLGSTWTNAGSSSSPYRLGVGEDNNVYLCDDESVNSGVWLAAPDLSAVSQLFGETGDTAGIAAGVHAHSFGEPVVFGSIATSNLVLWVADNTLPVGGGTKLGVNTAVGDYNNLDKYEIGAGPLPWNSAPDLSINLGISSIGTLDDDIDVGPVTGNVFGMNYRLNYGMPCLQVFDPTGQNLLWSSLEGPINVGPDVFNPVFTESTGTVIGPGAISSFAIKISPDEKFIAVGMVNNPIFIMNLTNGVPDASTLSIIPNAPNTTAYEDLRAMCWDAGDNVYTVSSGQGLLRVFSLGLTTTCVTSNDYTGTNGSFHIVLPPLSATVTATTSAASQNYGTPTPGVFTITLSTNFLAAPVTVNFVIGGTASNGMFTASETNSVTFPAGTNTAGNMTETVIITPTALPLSGPSTTVTLKVIGGSAYLAASPVEGTVTIANTGPQYISITSVSASSMYRGVSNDYGSFVITRLGDTNGPGGDKTPSTLTLTNFTYGGTAAFGTDYLAGAQLAVGSYPVSGSPGVAINPGDVTVTVVVGNPVPTPYGKPAVGNKTIIVGLGGTNETSKEGSSYTVSSGTATLSVIDNANPPEIVLYSNPLTNAADSVNWTLTFANTNLGATTVGPVVIKNYPNISPQTYANDVDGNNDFDVEFGYAVSADTIPQSEAMGANGWTTALKMSVNKDPNFIGSSAGVNVYPQGKEFSGNFALRFNMNLVEGTGLTGTGLSEFAEFGINHFGTNCNWISGDISTYGSLYTNIDGFWTAIASDAGAATGGTPPDYGLYSATSFPNSNVVYQPLSDPATAYTSEFKHPTPYTATGGGTPANQSGSAETSWSDVEFRQFISGGSNVATISINKTVVLSLTNTTIFTNGEIMLGYLDPFANNGAGSGAAAYYSNLRVVEVAPSITDQPLSVTIPVGQTATFTVSATGAGPFTNLWYSGTTLVQSNVVTTSSDSSSLVISDAVATNSGTYSVSISDASSGTVWSAPATLTVVGPTSPKVTEFSLSANGSSALLQFSTADEFDTTNSFVLQNSTNLAEADNYGFTNIVPTPSFISVTSGVFSVEAPTNGVASFYRLLHK
jgi:hypothetical protein